MSNFEKEISEIATLRETKGKEQETLRRINELLPKVTEAEDWKTVATLHWESHLVWQHTVMSELNKPSDKRDTSAIKYGTEKMMESAEKAKEIIENHRLEEMIGVAYRFLGRAATYAGNHAKAKGHYEAALNNFKGENYWSKLEVNGFLAESLVRLGQPKEGLSLALKTFKDFFDSEIGQSLKKEDYYTWAIWMSGIAPRTYAALSETGASIDVNKFKTWLMQSKSELENPSGAVTRGDPNFEFRINEIDAELETLKR